MMFRHAGRVMEAEGFDFLFSGEVLGERPMSQNRQSLRVVARESGYPERILRPLSARLLPETAPEREGKVDRSRLLDIEGRSRTRQMDLAARYGIHEYPSPGGGCRLTEPVFSRRLRDLFHHREDALVRDIELLKLGRHLRIGEHTKIVVGRNEQENDQLEALRRQDDVLLHVEDIPGPVVLIPHGASEESLHRAAAICVRYSDAPPDAEGYVRCIRGTDEQRMLVKACPDEATRDLMI
jgi:tRNA U34 2-thiouridine synthase MnmA/TrmU